MFSGQEVIDFPLLVIAKLFQVLNISIQLFCHWQAIPEEDSVCVQGRNTFTWEDDTDEI